MVDENEGVNSSKTSNRGLQYSFGEYLVFFCMLNSFLEEKSGMRTYIFDVFAFLVH